MFFFKVSNTLNQKCLEDHIFTPPFNEQLNFLVKIKSQLYSLEYTFEKLKQFTQLKTIFVITLINSNELTELANLVRLKNTLSLIPKLEWILVDEAFNQSQKILNFTNSTHFPNITYLVNSIDTNENSSNQTNGDGKKLYVKALNWLILNKSYLKIENVVCLFSRSSTAYSMKFFDEVGNFQTKNFNRKPTTL